jgi:hypothetical protein
MIVGKIDTRLRYDGEDLFLPHDEKLLPVDHYFGPDEAAEQNAVTFGDRVPSPRPVWKQLPVANRQDTSLFRRFAGTLGQHNAAWGDLIGLNPFDYDLVAQWHHFHYRRTPKKRLAESTQVTIPEVVSSEHLGFRCRNTAGLDTLPTLPQKGMVRFASPRETRIVA